MNVRAIICYITSVLGHRILESHSVNYEVWLRTNRRALLVLSIFPATVVAASAVLLFFVRSPIGFWLNAGLLITGSIWLAMLIRRGLRPRLAYCDGKLLVFLQGSQPIAVPINIVECFFLGQGASLLPRTFEGRHGEAGEATTVIVRLAEAAQDWSHREVRAALGQWCEGYITLRGTWCEPLNGDVVARLNQRLVTAHRTFKQTGEAVPA